MTARDFSERDIHLSLDGELPADEVTAFESWLAANPEMNARRDRFLADRDLMRASFAGMIDEPVPAHLTAVVASDRPRKRPLHWRLAAAAVIVVTGGLTVYLLGMSGWRPSVNPNAQLADNAIAAHVIYAAEKLHVVEVGADQRDHLVSWLSKRIGIPLVAPDLDAQGYELIGGRLLPAAGERTAAQFMYQDASGNRISVYVTRDPSNKETGFRILEERGARALYWLDDGYGCAITGTAPQEVLLTVANEAYKQLLQGMSEHTGG